MIDLLSLFEYKMVLIKPTDHHPLSHFPPLRIPTPRSNHSKQFGTYSYRHFPFCLQTDMTSAPAAGELRGIHMCDSSPCFSIRLCLGDLATLEHIDLPWSFLMLHKVPCCNAALSCCFCCTFFLLKLVITFFNTIHTYRKRERSMINSVYSDSDSGHMETSVPFKPKPTLFSLLI